MAIVTAGDKGRNAFVGNRGIHYLCETVIRQTFRCEDALKVKKLKLIVWIRLTRSPMIYLFTFQSFSSYYYTCLPVTLEAISGVEVAAQVRQVVLAVAGHITQEQRISIHLC